MLEERQVFSFFSNFLEILRRENFQVWSVTELRVEYYRAQGGWSITELRVEYYRAQGGWSITELRVDYYRAQGGVLQSSGWSIT